MCVYVWSPHSVYVERRQSDEDNSYHLFQLKSNHDFGLQNKLLGSHTNINIQHTHICENNNWKTHLFINTYIQKKMYVSNMKTLHEHTFWLMNSFVFVQTMETSDAWQPN